MAIAAVPRYLGNDFSTASPGMRFGMYLQLWGTNNRTRKMLWTTHDVNYRVAGRERQEREFRDDNKAVALAQATVLNCDDRALMSALAIRQTTLAGSIAPTGQLFRIQAQAIAPFTTGLGNEHPLENGFAFLNPYGLPYLPGSGVKGVVRQAARELASGEWGESQGWSKDDPRYSLRIGNATIRFSMLDALFGLETKDGETEHLRGALSFWDVIPQIKGDALQVEIMTAHQTHYYQHDETPHESGSPNPISFLTVPPGSGFTFHVQCDVPHLQRLAPELVTNGAWKELLRAAFTHAFDWLGFGAKTAVGYGAMRRDETAEAAAEKARIERERAAREAAEAERIARDREAVLAALSPIEREIQEFLNQRSDRNQSAISAVIGALQQGRWEGKDKLTVARWLQKKMQAESGQWKETTQAKRPEKDKAFARTRLVKAWLAGE